MALSKETIEGNELIASFMGRDNAHDPRDRIYHYDTSWDWLMPVWNKIAQWGLVEHGVQWTQEISTDGIKISTNRNKMYDYALPTIRHLPTIEDLWLAAIKFITWYNTQQSNNQ